MLKIIYKADPYYTPIGGLNEPCSKHLTVEFDTDASSTEILAEVVKIMEYMGYSKFSYSRLHNAIMDLVYDGVIADDRTELTCNCCEDCQEND